MKKLAALILLCLAASDLFAVDLAGLTDDQKAQFLSEATTTVPRSNSSPNFFGMDNSVDPGLYLIGPGDEFFISVVGLPSNSYTVTVNQNCDLYIPEIGIIKVGRTMLREARQIIAHAIQSKLRRPNDVYVTLTRIKQATFSVTGAVANPGTYQMNGNFRVLDAIKMANNGTLPSFSDCNFREICCTESDSAFSLDLFQYLMTNNSSGNPYVYPGEGIMIRLATSRVVVTGAVKNPVSGGAVSIKKNESLESLLSLFPFDASADSNSILVQKADGSPARLYAFNSTAGVTLDDRDIITVMPKENYPEFQMVSISGETAKPGVYPIRKGITTAKMIIDRAGGATSFGNIDKAFILRRSKVNAQKPQSSATLQSINQMTVVRPEMYAAFNKMNLTNDYSFIFLKDYDFGSILQTDDQIVIPKNDPYIYVSGDVRQPGGYTFVPGKPCGYYIAEAGGFTSKADKWNMFAVTQYNGFSQIKDVRNLNDGDVLVIPDSQQSKFFVSILFPILGIVLTAVGTAVTLYSVSHK